MVASLKRNCAFSPHDWREKRPVCSRSGPCLWAPGRAQPGQKEGVGRQGQNRTQVNTCQLSVFMKTVANDQICPVQILILMRERKSESMLKNDRRADVVEDSGRRAP